MDEKDQKRAGEAGPEAAVFRSAALGLLLVVGLINSAAASVVILESLAFAGSLPGCLPLIRRREYLTQALRFVAALLAIGAALAASSAPSLRELALANVALGVCTLFPATRQWLPAILLAVYSSFLLALGVVWGSAPGGLLSLSEWNGREVAVDHAGGGWLVLSWLLGVMMLVGIAGVMGSTRWRNRASLLLVLALLAMAFAHGRPSVAMIFAAWGLLPVSTLGEQAGTALSPRRQWFLTLTCVAAVEASALTGWLSADAYLMRGDELSGMVSSLDHRSVTECQGSLSSLTHGLTSEELREGFPTSARLWEQFESLATVRARQRAMPMLVEMFEDEPELRNATITCRWSRLHLRRAAILEFTRRWDLSRDAAGRVLVDEVRIREPTEARVDVRGER